MILKKTVVSLLTAVLMVSLVLGLGTNIRAQSPPNQVGLVVQFGDGTTLTRCVTFDEPEISGYDVLVRSGLNVVASAPSGIGVAICKIQDQGCPAENCFCTCQGATCNYWTYWHLDGDDWRYAHQGATSYTVRHGDVEGWRWSTEASPPAVSFVQICAPPTNTPLPATDTPQPTATNLPPTLTPTITLSVTPTDTNTPAKAQPTQTALPPVTVTPITPATATSQPTQTSPLLTATPTPVTVADTPTALAKTTVTSGATGVAAEQRGGQNGYLFFGISLIFVVVVLVTVLKKR